MGNAGNLAFPKGLASGPGRPRVPPASPVVFDVQLVYVPGELLLRLDLVVLQLPAILLIKGFRSLGSTYQSLVSVFPSALFVFDVQPVYVPCRLLMLVEISTHTPLVPVCDLLMQRQSTRS